MTILLDRGVAQVHHKTWKELAEVVERCDLLCVDAPYSERTHAGHDGGTGGRVGPQRRGNGEVYAAANRRALDYGAWTETDVRDFVAAWSPRTSGWMVSITDHALAPIWADAMEIAGRYSFAPIAFVAPGSRVRLGGDGPSQWSTFITVARPRSNAFRKWGTLPGGYVLPSGWSERMDIVGGKPAWLMERLVEDYSRPGQLVVDPCCGAGTTVTAALRTGRRAIGGDAMLEHAEMAARAAGGMVQMPLIAS